MAPFTIQMVSMCATETQNLTPDKEKLLSIIQGNLFFS